MADASFVSPYLRQPIERSYRDFLKEQIGRLEAERRRIDDQLAAARDELAYILDREFTDRQWQEENWGGTHPKTYDDSRCLISDRAAGEPGGAGCRDAVDGRRERCPHDRIRSRPTLSLSGPDPPAASWRRALARTASAGSYCSKPAAWTPTAGSISRSASARPSPTRRSTGATRPSPIPAPPAAACSGRAARCSAAPPRSTAWFISAVRPRISTIGASSAMPAGRSRTCCPISSAPSIKRAAPTPSTARAGRSACPMS